MIRPRSQIFADAEELAQRTAAWLCTLALELPAAVFSVCLSGGSTPKRLYEILAGRDFIDRFPWSRVHWFWGDERFVPTDDKRSNYRMVREALSRAPLREANIHAIPTEGLTPAEAAVAYERELKLFYGTEMLDPSRPLFDVTFLGLGEDGHTASLFPGTVVLDERRRWVAAVLNVKEEPRITLTYPVLESSRHVVFLIAGAGKQRIFARLRNDPASVPAGRIHPVGELLWFADRAAALDEAATETNASGNDRAALKKAAAQRAVTEVADGMVVGLGTGSTASLAVSALAERMKAGLRITGIPTSEATAAMAKGLGIPLASLSGDVRPDLTIDGADEVERGGLALIKGRGGALLREKIVASASKRVIIIVDGSKLVDRLGAQAPVPVEIVRFGWEVTRRRLRELGATVSLRLGLDGAAFETDGGNYILDCLFGPIADPRGLANWLAATVGVVESGLFIDIADQVVIAGGDGVKILSRP